MNVYRMNATRYVYSPDSNFLSSPFRAKPVRLVRAGDLVIVLHGPVRRVADDESFYPFEDWYVIMCTDGDICLLEYEPISSSGPLFVSV